MAALVSALDNYTPKQFGENGHVEYGWSNSVQEKIVQFSFQLTRISKNDKTKIDALSVILSDLLRQLKFSLNNGSIVEKQIAKGYLSVLYKMIGHTRDIIGGKGEYELSYMMIYTWYAFFPELALFALKCFVDLGDIHQYGSWKDLKYFCDYCLSKNVTVSMNSELIQYPIQLMNSQLKKDYEKYQSNKTDISLVAKWVPREKSSFSWMYQCLATDYFSNYMTTARTDIQRQKAILKCKMEYRKLLSTLNKYIDTVQVKQCGKNWHSIDFNKVTSITLSKQKNAFLNIKKDGSVKHSEDEDRIICAENFRSHIQRAVKGEIEMKGKRVGMEDFTKQALELIQTILKFLII